MTYHNRTQRNVVFVFQKIDQDHYEQGGGGHDEEGSMVLAILRLY